MKTIIIAIVAMAANLANARVINISDYQKNQLKSSKPAAKASSTENIESLEKIQLKKKYSSILGNFTNVELYDMKSVLESKLESMLPVVTRISIEEINKDFKLVINHWVLGDVKKTVSVSIKQLDQIRLTEEGSLHVKLLKSEEGGVLLAGKDTDLIIRENPADFIVEARDGERINLTDPYVNPGEYYKQTLYRIDNLPRYDEREADLMTLINYLQLEMQNKGVKSRVPITDFFKGKYAEAPLYSCAAAFN